VTGHLLNLTVFDQKSSQVYCWLAVYLYCTRSSAIAAGLCEVLC